MSDEFKSKSQKKRDAQVMLDLARELVELRVEALAQLPLTEPLRKAILDAKLLKSHGAVRRQALWIGKFLRTEGGDAVLEALTQLRAVQQGQTAEFHQVELWRTRLMAVPDGQEALTALVNAYPMIDLQVLRQLIKKAQLEREQALHTGAQRALFRFLRSLMA